MSFYQKLGNIVEKYNLSSSFIKLIFNLSPMYRRSTAKITKVSEDLQKIEVKLAISYKNKNYNGSVFGGSMFAAVDPIPMVQLLHLLRNEFVVWDKSAEIYFKRPAKENLYADFEFTQEEIQNIKNRVQKEKEITIVKSTFLTNRNRDQIFCEVQKTIYIAEKSFYAEKKKMQAAKRSAQLSA